MDEKPKKPIPPFCIHTLSSENDCDEFEISNYNLEIDIYNRKSKEYRMNVDMYIYQLNGYVKDAESYARCEASNL